MCNYCYCCDFSGGDGGLVVGSGSVNCDYWGVSTGGGFQRSYDDLTP